MAKIGSIEPLARDVGRGMEPVEEAERANPLKG